MIWLKWVALSLGVLVLIVIATAAYGTSRWAEATKVLLARLEAARVPAPVARFHTREIDGLPAPVQRYFRSALTHGQPIVAAVWLEHVGSMNMSETAQRWKPFTSQQRVVTRRPGFDWSARIMVLPGVPVLVHDAYIAGVGMLRGAMFGLIPVVNMADTPEMAQGELLRFFAETAWYPTALLPSQGVRWEAIDDSSARATLVDGNLAVTLTFRFHEDASIDTVRAESRSRGNSGSAPWQGRFWSYALQGGMRVPLEGEVAWELPEGTQPYWRGRITALSYEFAKE